MAMEFGFNFFTNSSLLPLKKSDDNANGLFTIKNLGLMKKKVGYIADFHIK